MNELDLIGPLFIAAFLGALLGLERSVAGKHAGMRTYALVSLGSCLLVILATLTSYMFANFSGVNPVAVIGSIAIGIGFIGSGLATMKGEHAELTTASGIWVASGVGIACGFGLYLIAATSTMLGLIIFSLFLRFENAVRTRVSKEE